MEFLKNYWPLLLISTWLLYKWWNSKRILRLLPELKKNGALFVDVRSNSEYSNGNAPDTKNIPLQELVGRLGEIPKDKTIVLCCATGTRSSMAKMLLKKHGYKNVYNIGPWTKFLS